MTFFFEKSTAMPAELLSISPVRLYAQHETRQLVPVADIICLEADVNNCWVYLNDGQQLRTAKTLKFHHAQLPADWFIRLHRHCVVNRQYIEKIELVDGRYQVDVAGGKSYPVSRRRWSQIRRQLLGNQAANSRSIKADFR